MKVLALLLCPCLVAILIHVWLSQNGPYAFLSMRVSAYSRQSYPEVLVGILSARHHYDLREAIRETWMGHLKNHPEFQKRVDMKFIIGQHGCNIPDEDREDPYSCILLNLTESVPGQEVEIVSGFRTSMLTSSEVSMVSLDFKVIHPIVITGLGVFPKGPNQDLPGNVSVALFPLDQEEPVMRANFSHTNPGVKTNGIWYKPVEQFILPKGFEGSVLWQALDSADLKTLNISKVQLNNGGGVLKISPIEDGVLPHRGARTFPGLAGGFTFSIYDAGSLSELLRDRPMRLERHRALLRQEEAMLEHEALQHSDIVFVEVVDTYRNVPTKLLQFFKWSIQNSDFKLLLKADDDCYIDIDGVLEVMDEKHSSRRNFWWGNFRQNWAVDIAGKWQELEYASPVYPAFACGSGYVVSRDLVEWLAANAGRLKAYQGEDVSMGIWMAAVCPQKHQDSRWLCEQDCYVDMLSSPQHTAQELRLLWHGKQECGDPCGCPWTLD